ncbi:group 10 secretory phospholipase A2-like isoform X1 [Mixophyes fleayi]|uniref:group 10 secretory phospholipase A2-like isoform X1 n=1 Tax=Mixophyes fleayi TaxID=3061075 RepID=UPI003F4DF9B9
MERKILLLFFLCNTLNGELGKTYTRQKRGLFELAGVIGCGTGKSSLLYVGYGCYCGLGGRGTPVDSSDRDARRKGAEILYHIGRRCVQPDIKVLPKT